MPVSPVSRRGSDFRFFDLTGVRRDLAIVDSILVQCHRVVYQTGFDDSEARRSAIERLEAVISRLEEN